MSDCGHMEVIYVLLSELNEAFGIVTMTEELAITMGIEEGLLQYNFSYNKLGKFNDTADIKNRWKELWSER